MEVNGLNKLQKRNPGSWLEKNAMLCALQITIFRMGEGAQDIDLAILTALLKGVHFICIKLIEHTLVFWLAIEI